jgi:hypothetical protein
VATVDPGAGATEPEPDPELADTLEPNALNACDSETTWAAGGAETCTGTPKS